MVFDKHLHGFHLDVAVSSTVMRLPRLCLEPVHALQSTAGRLIQSAWLLQNSSVTPISRCFPRPDPNLRCAGLLHEFIGLGASFLHPRLDAVGTVAHVVRGYGKNPSLTPIASYGVLDVQELNSV